MRRTILTAWSEAENHHRIAALKPSIDWVTPDSITNVGQASSASRSGVGPPEASPSLDDLLLALVGNVVPCIGTQLLFSPMLLIEEMISP
jgi:hypothetical protein